MKRQYCPECGCHLPSARAKQRIEPWIRDREKGVTMREIGEREGVSTEQVRQWFIQAGRPDLCRVQRIYKTKPCRGCGKDIRVAHRASYCSAQCRKAAKRTAAEKKLRPFVKARREGSSWKQIAEAQGYKGKHPDTAIRNRVHFLAERHGIDFNAMVAGQNDGEAAA